MSISDTAKTTALVLCGGKGTRLGGVDKPLIDLGDGETIVERVVGELRSHVSEILLSCDRSRPDYESLGLLIVPDRRTNAGPLAGIEAGLTECKTEFCFVCPGDAPGISHEIPERLAESIGAARVAYPYDGVRGQHLFALVRRSALATITAMLDQGHNTVAACFDSLGAVSVEMQNERWFYNINTADDLLRWRELDTRD